MDVLILLFVVISLVRSLMKRAQKAQETAAGREAAGPPSPRPKAAPAPEREAVLEKPAGPKAPAQPEPETPFGYRESSLVPLHPESRFQSGLEGLFEADREGVHAPLHREAADRPETLAAPVLPLFFDRDRLLGAVVMGEILTRPALRRRPGTGTPARPLP